MAEAAKEAEKRKHIFPFTSRVYRLALTAPVTVAGNERTFSKLKTVKTALRNSMSEHRLQNLIIAISVKHAPNFFYLDVITIHGYNSFNVYSLLRPNFPDSKTSDAH